MAGPALSRPAVLRIRELAGHLTAATCRFLLLVADFDARRGWTGWEMPSCAAWLSWKCQIAPGTAREQVRVATLTTMVHDLAGNVLNAGRDGDPAIGGAGVCRRGGDADVQIYHVQSLHLNALYRTIMVP